MVAADRENADDCCMLSSRPRRTIWVKNCAVREEDEDEEEGGRQRGSGTG
jgi:hypothetical protein